MKDHISKYQEESTRYVTHSRVIFDKLQGVLKCGQTWSSVFDISSQSKLKLKRKCGNKITLCSSVQYNVVTGWLLLVMLLSNKAV